MLPCRCQLIIILVSFVYYSSFAIAGKGTSEESLFKKCHKNVCTIDEKSLRFLLVGDWGGLPIWPYYTYTEHVVAKGMATIARQQHTHFQMALGDNFYYTGVTSLSDMRFKRTFEDIFTDEALYSPWYVLAGNHDHHGNVSAQIKYRSSKNDRWKFPNYYYALQFELDPVDVLVEVIVIDTVQLCGNIKNDVFNLFRKNNQPSGPTDVKASEKQWEWLADRLKKSKAHFLFVAGHFPVWSIAEHGPTHCLVDRLEPLLRLYNVTAYFAGHDHNLQHIQTHDSHGHVVLNYVGSGCGAFMDSSTENKGKIPAGSLRYSFPQHSFLKSVVGGIGFGKGGFVLADVNSTTAAFKYYRGDGELLYSFIAAPRLDIRQSSHEDDDDKK